MRHIDHSPSRRPGPTPRRSAANRSGCGLSRHVTRMSLLGLVTGGPTGHACQPALSPRRAATLGLRLVPPAARPRILLPAMLWPAELSRYGRRGKPASRRTLPAPRPHVPCGRMSLAAATQSPRGIVGGQDLSDPSRPSRSCRAGLLGHATRIVQTGRSSLHSEWPWNGSALNQSTMGHLSSCCRQLFRHFSFCCRQLFRRLSGLCS